MKNLWCGVLLLIGAGCGSASGTTINFEQYAAGTVIANRYAGVSFSGAVEETSASVASMLAYKPESGSGFISNAAGSTITATFSTTQSAVGGFYTAYTGAEVVAYDLSGDVLLTQMLAGNLGANTAWAIQASGISSIAFTAPTGTLALDNVTYTTPTAVTPEPVSLLFMGTGLFSGAGLCVYRAARAKRAVLDDARGAVRSFRSGIFT